jgi:hypothetical protein
MACRRDGKLHAPGVEKRVGGDEDGIEALAHKTCKGCIDLANGAGMEDLDLHPRAGAAPSTSFTVDSAVVALAGLTRTATRVAPGISRSSPSRFAVSSAMKKLIPVALPPGWARLATRPSLTGSSPTPKTIGIVEVAVFAAREAGVLAPVAITFTFWRIRSAASSG